MREEMPWWNGLEKMCVSHRRHPGDQMVLFCFLTTAVPRSKTQVMNQLLPFDCGIDQASPIARKHKGRGYELALRPHLGY